MRVSITRFRKPAFVLAGLMIAATFVIASVPARTTDDDTAAL